MQVEATPREDSVVAVVFLSSHSVSMSSGDALDAAHTPRSVPPTTLPQFSTIPDFLLVRCCGSW